MEQEFTIMTTEELLIHELAARAGISVRTIRYYIEEGLLPQPSYQGKYSYYTLNYLDRLELIRRLKEFVSTSTRNSRDYELTLG